MLNLHPLMILALGMLTVILMIALLRMNAFIALITSAVVVSLLAPGDLAVKISRVATAFGSTAGSIGIVIALAVVIGKCMMDSGAADRIVRGLCEYQRAHLDDIEKNVSLQNILHITGGATNPAMIRAKSKWMKDCKYIYDEQSSMKGAALLGLKYIEN